MCNKCKYATPRVISWAAMSGYIDVDDVDMLQDRQDPDLEMYVLHSGLSKIVFGPTSDEFFSTVFEDGDRGDTDYHSSLEELLTAVAEFATECNDDDYDDYEDNDECDYEDYADLDLLEHHA